MANPNFRLKVSGVKETVTRLQEFKRNIRTKVLRKAGNEASKFLLSAMKPNTPVAKRDYGPSGGLKKSLGRKVSVKKDRLWYGVGPRTSHRSEVTKKFKFWRGAGGKILKAPIAWTRREQPSRRSHLAEQKHHYITKTQRSTRSREQDIVRQTLAEAMREVAKA